MKNNSNDFSSPIIDSTRNKQILNKSNANLFDKFMTGPNEHHNNPINSQQANNLIIKNPNYYVGKNNINPDLNYGNLMIFIFYNW